MLDALGLVQTLAGRFSTEIGKTLDANRRCDIAQSLTRTGYKITKVLAANKPLDAVNRRARALTLHCRL